MSGHFFIGWSGRTGPALGRFLTLVGGGAVAGFAVLGFTLGVGLDDPSAGLIGLAPTPQVAPLMAEERSFEGVLEPGPYPVRLDPTADRPQGEALLLNGFGKAGIAVDPELYGARMAVTGVLLRRGDIAMLTTDGVFKPVAGRAAAAPAPVSLGRWRLAGELCDGKCYVGIMKPGTGLAHRACASLCFVGEVPLVFVAASPLAGGAFLVLADQDGGPPPDAVRRFIGVPASLEGVVERRGTLLVFRVDFATARLL